MDTRTKGSDKYLWAKIDKETGRIVGFLSSNKKKWLPMISAGQKLVVDIVEVNKLKFYYKNRFGSKKNHPYIYKEFNCSK